MEIKLEQAIDEEDCKANLCCQLGDIEWINNDFEGTVKFICKEKYHKQIAEWLKELLLIKQTRVKLNGNNQNNNIIICPKCRQFRIYENYHYFCPHCGTDDKYIGE